MVCRGFLLELERRGYIKLPPRKHNPPNPFVVNRTKPAPIAIDTTPISAKVSGIQPLTINQVRKTASEKIFNSLMAEHHYLGYSQPITKVLTYI